MGRRPRRGSLRGGNGLSDTRDWPLGGVILSLIGGVLVLADGALVAAAGGLASSLGLAGGGLIEGLGAVGAFFGLLLIVVAILLVVTPDHHLALGVAILIFSLLSIVSGGGFIIGLILGVIGGILGIIFQPDEDLDFDERFGFSRPTGGRICPRCAASVPPGSTRFCPSCGGPL